MSEAPKVNTTTNVAEGFRDPEHPKLIHALQEVRSLLHLIDDATDRKTPRKAVDRIRRYVVVAIEEIDEALGEDA